MCKCLSRRGARVKLFLKTGHVYPIPVPAVNDYFAVNLLAFSRFILDIFSKMPL